MSLLIIPNTSQLPADLPQDEIERLVNVPENRLVSLEEKHMRTSKESDQEADRSEFPASVPRAERRAA